MSFIDPTTLGAIGSADPGQTAQQGNITLGTPSVTAPTATGAGGSALDAQSGASIINAFLQQYGLNTPETGAYAQQIATLGLSASDLTARIAADSTDTSSTLGKVVNQIYPEIAAYKAAHPNSAPLSVGDVANQRSQLATLMQQAGLPPGFYDQPEDFKDLIASAGTQATSIATQRINNGFVKVANADPLIRQAFAGYFGPNGDQALAAYFLDPAKSQPLLDQQVAAAQVGGIGAGFGFNIGQGQATQLAQAGVTDAQARSGFSNLNHLSPLFQATISEDNNLTAENQGINAQFNLGAGQNEIDKRLQQRVAAFSGSGGSGGLSVSSGQTGLGSARSR